MIAGESHAFSQGFDYGISLNLLFKNMCVHMPLYVFTDSKSVFDTITASKRLKKLRLMNEIAYIRRAYRDNEITNVGWVRSEHNIADSLTRFESNETLRTAMQTEILCFTIQEWVYKDNGSIPSTKAGETETRLSWIQNPDSEFPQKKKKSECDTEC